MKSLKSNSLIKDFMANYKWLAIFFSRLNSFPSLSLCHNKKTKQSHFRTKTQKSGNGVEKDLDIIERMFVC